MSVQLRGDFFPRCNIRILVAHKSGSSSVLKIFSKLCGKATGGDRANSDTSLVTTVAIVRDPVERSVSMYNMLLSNRLLHEEHEYLTRAERVRAADTRDPSHDDVRWRFGRFLDWLASEPQLVGAQEQARVTRGSFARRSRAAKAMGAMDVMRRWHYRPQARYYGVGATDPPHIDLVGRVCHDPHRAMQPLARCASRTPPRPQSATLPRTQTQCATAVRPQVEALPELVTRLANISSSFASNHDRAEARSVSRWQLKKVPLPSGTWRMSPCLVDWALLHKVGSRPAT